MFNNTPLPQNPLRWVFFPLQGPGDQLGDVFELGRLLRVGVLKYGQYRPQLLTQPVGLILVRFGQLPGGG